MKWDIGEKAKREAARKEMFQNKLAFHSSNFFSHLPGLTKLHFAKILEIVQRSVSSLCHQSQQTAKETDVLSFLV